MRPITITPKSIFISCSKQELDIAERLFDELERLDYRPWLFSRSIRAGEDGDRAIQGAIESCVAVVLLLSQASAGSTYVRDEIRHAHGNQKTVIPVEINRARLPLTWSSHQRIPWNGKSPAETVSAIVRGLPSTAKAELIQALDAPGDNSQIRALIQAHVEWLPIEYFMSPDYQFIADLHIAGRRRVDCFAARLDSGGPRAYLYYFGPPQPQAGDLDALVEDVRQCCTFLSRAMPSKHRVNPRRLFRAERKDWRLIHNYYAEANCTIYVGRRTEGDPPALSQQLVEAALSELPRRYGIAVASYDRLLSAIPE